MKKNGPVSKMWLYLNLALAIIVIAGAGLLFVWAGQQSAKSTMRPPDARLGQAAADFSLLTPAGESVTLDEYRGRVVLVNFWATWCPPCVAELPALEDFYQTRQEQGFVILAVNAEETPAVVIEFAQANNLSFPVLLDSDGGLMEQYAVRALPVSFVIDRAGIIRHVQRGEISLQELKAVVEPLL